MFAVGSKKTLKILNNGSTVVIVPPGGNMADYIASLRRLLDYDVKVVAPGHGELIPDCRGEVEKLVRHRLMREAKVASALDSVPRSLDGLVVTVNGAGDRKRWLFQR